MQKYLLSAFFALSFLFAATAQERAKPKGPADFPKMLELVGQNWRDAKYGACIKNLNGCIELASQKRTDAVLSALPAAPDGWTKIEDKRQQAANPFAAAMAGAVGNIMEQNYKETSGRATIGVTVTADSPLVSMLSMGFGIAAADPEVEVIGYGAHKALLKKQGSGLSLQILIADAHVVDVNMSVQQEDLLFRLFDQAAVDRIATALAN